MNHSIHSADRATHLKIVVVALVAGIAVAGFGISARSNADFTQTARHPRHEGGQAGGGDEFGCFRRSANPSKSVRNKNGRPWGGLFVGGV